MSDVELINKILLSKTYIDIFNINEYETDYKRFMKLIHPDVCHQENATKAVAILNNYKAQIADVIVSIDDSGNFKYNPYKILYSENKLLQDIAYINFKKLKHPTDSKAKNFQRYLPKDMLMHTTENNLRMCMLDKRAIPLTDLTLEQKHVNWVISRIMEFSCWLNFLGYSHCGITPETIFVVPETHGVIFTSLYHLTELNTKINTISAKYRTWYPDHVFTKKIATEDIDVCMIKRMSYYLLGDKSGNGTKLKMDKSMDKNYIDFMQELYTHPVQFYMKYREFLSNTYKKEFHVLNL